MGSISTDDVQASVHVIFQLNAILLLPMIHAVYMDDFKSTLLEFLQNSTHLASNAPTTPETWPWASLHSMHVYLAPTCRCHTGHWTGILPWLASPPIFNSSVSWSFSTSTMTSIVHAIVCSRIEDWNSHLAFCRPSLGPTPPPPFSQFSMILPDIGPLLAFLK